MSKKRFIIEVILFVLAVVASCILIFVLLFGQTGEITFSFIIFTLGAWLLFSSTCLTNRDKEIVHLKSRGIIITRRPSDYMANFFIEGHDHKEAWDCGKNMAEAIGRLLLSHPEYFHITIIGPDTEAPFSMGKEVK